MKIITWNCNMAFRKKANFILEYNPDILIVPECEHLDKLKFPFGTPEPNDKLWFGINQNKGLGIFSYSDFRFRVIETHNPELRMIIPIEVTGGEFDFNLYAVWANNPNDHDGHYIVQVWKALNHYESELTNKRTILIGDFNSNTIWDKKHREGNHTNVVKRLEEKGIFSADHLHHSQAQGNEQHPTLFMYRHKDKSYHIDYCFISEDLVNKLKSVEVGEFDEWIKYSDHVPLIVNLDVD